MKGQKFKTVVVHPFDVPEYQAGYTAVHRTAIRDEIRQGQDAKAAAKFNHGHARRFARYVREYDDLMRRARNHDDYARYEYERNKWVERWADMMRTTERLFQEAVDHGHKANALDNPQSPRRTHEAWFRAHDAARLSRRLYRRPARVNTRVETFAYEDRAEYDVVDKSQVKWTRLLAVLVCYLRFR